MRILIVSGQERSSEAFKAKEQALLDAFLSASAKHKLAVAFPGKKLFLQIEQNGIVVYELPSVQSKTTHIPKFTPGSIREYTRFISEFRPDVIHCFDSEFIGLITQVAAVSKEIPFILELPKESNDQKGLGTRIMNTLLDQAGITSEFASNYYNNCTAILGRERDIFELKKDGSYNGHAFEATNINNPEALPAFYKKMQKRLQKSVRTKRFGSIVKLLPIKSLRETLLQKMPEKEIRPYKKKVVPASLIIAGAAVIGSLLTFTTLKGWSKLKRKQPNNN